jgi:endoglucanase
MLSKTLYLFNIGLIFIAYSSIAQQATEHQPSPVELFGALSTSGAKLISENRQPVSLAGPSLFWSNDGWEGEAFYNSGVVTTVAKDWKASVIRAAMGVDNRGSFINSPDVNRAKVKSVVDAAVDNGIYVIIDWHSHHAEDVEEQAIEFFTAMAKQYGHLPNVIYEIYNEPLRDTDWATVIKPYAEKVITAIRQVDPDNIIIVGTQTWSQDVDKAAELPLQGFTNIVYALHFYAGTHGQELRDRAQSAIDKGLPLFISEWGSVNANGDGQVDIDESMKWLVFAKQNGLSQVSWSISNKVEGASMIKPGASTWGGWSQQDLTVNGVFMREVIRAWHER